MLTHAIEMLHATRVKQVLGVYPQPDGRKRYRMTEEPERVYRFYPDYHAAMKDMLFLNSQTWPTAKAKSARYFGCRFVDPMKIVVWC